MFFKFHKIHWKAPVLPATLLKIDPNTRCFSVKIKEILRIVFFMEQF